MLALALEEWAFNYRPWLSDTLPTLKQQRGRFLLWPDAQKQFHAQHWARIERIDTDGPWAYLARDTLKAFGHNRGFSRRGGKTKMVAVFSSSYCHRACSASPLSLKRRQTSRIFVICKILFVRASKWILWQLFFAFKHQALHYLYSSVLNELRLIFSCAALDKSLHSI